MPDHVATPWASGPCLRCGAACDALHIAAGEPLCGQCCPECRVVPLEGPVRAGVAGEQGKLW